MINLALVIILSYIIGSIPSSIIIAKIFAGVNIIECGSGNPGAANVYRNISPTAGVLTAVFDIFKGIVATLWIARIAYDISFFNNETISFIAGSAAILGHIFSIFLKFNGGKGVATAAGVFFTMTPIATGISFIIFVLIIITTRISSLGSIISSFSMPIILFSMRNYFDIKISKNSICFALLIALFILLVHRKNIDRLIKGKENKV